MENVDMSHCLLPPAFAELEPFIDWSLATESERLQKRLDSSMEEIRAYYSAMLDHIEEMLEYLNGFAFTEPRRTDAKKYPLKGAMNLYFIFPNAIMGLMRDSYWMYNVWPLAVDRTIWEIGMNTVPPRNAGELFSQEYNKIGLRDTLMEDTATHEKVQQVLKSGAKEYFRGKRGQIYFFRVNGRYTG